MALPAEARTLLSAGSFGGGFVNSLVVLVHLLGLVAAGVWADQQGGAALWRVPVILIAAALAAGTAAHLEIGLPYAAEGLALVPVALGGLAVLAVRLPPVAVVLPAALAGVFQGHPQAVAAATTPAPGLYWIGFGVGALLAVAAGVGLGEIAAQVGSARQRRLLGGALAAAGVLVLLGWL